MSKRVIKKNTKQKKVLKNEKSEFIKFFTNLIVVLICLVIVYLICAIFITKDIDIFNKKNDTVLTQSSNILITETFTMKDKEYYVFLYDSEKDDYEEIKQFISSKEGIKVYYVDLSSAINKAKVSTSSNRDAQKYTDLKINGNTVIKVENWKNVLYLENKDEILNNFN